MNEKYKCSVVIKKNTPELREKLRALGIRENTLDQDIENPEMWLVSNHGVYVTRRDIVELSFLQSTNQKDPGDIDILCEPDEEELFLALAGLQEGDPVEVILRHRGK